MRNLGVASLVLGLSLVAQPLPAQEVPANVEKVIQLKLNEAGDDFDREQDIDVIIRKDRGEKVVWRCDMKFKITIEKVCGPCSGPPKPFTDRAIEAMKELRLVHQSGPPRDADPDTHVHYYKCTYVLDNGNDWDPHIVIDWP